MFEGLFAPMHLIIILVIALIIFGPGKLPELGEGLAKAIKSFKKGMKDIKDEVNSTPLEQKEYKGEEKTTPTEKNEDKIL